MDAPGPCICTAGPGLLNECGPECTEPPLLGAPRPCICRSGAGHCMECLGAKTFECLWGPVLGRIQAMHLHVEAL